MGCGCNSKKNPPLPSFTRIPSTRILLKSRGEVAVPKVAVPKVAISEVAIPEVAMNRGEPVKKRFHMPARLVHEGGKRHLFVNH